MPFCTNCGKPVTPEDLFCGSCGAPQANSSRRRAAASAPSADFMANLSPRTASMLCYIPVVGGIPAIAVLLTRRFQDDRKVRFNAFQGLYLFVAWLLVGWFIEDVIPGRMEGLITGVMRLTLLGAWIFMLIQAAQERMFRLPVIGDLADRSVSEQAG